jgi:hypothetical protein
MSRRRLPQCLLYPALLLAFGPGCQALYRYRPVAVQAKDAETGQPIPGAEVRIAYPVLQSAFAPSDAAATAGADSIARLQAAPYRDTGIVVAVNAPGYLAEEKFIPTEEVEAIKPAGLFESVDRRPPNFVLQLYPEPRPTVELVLPAGYRGTIRAEIQAQDDTRGEPGQRRFSYAVPPSGIVRVAGPALLRHVFVLDFAFKYADGAPLSANAKDSEVGFWWLEDQGSTHHFFIGTREEYDRTRPAASERAGEGSGQRRGSGRGQGGGRGRQGRRGGATSP